MQCKKIWAAPGSNSGFPWIKVPCGSMSVEATGKEGCGEKWGPQRWPTSIRGAATQAILWQPGEACTAETG